MSYITGLFYKNNTSEKLSISFASKVIESPHLSISFDEKSVKFYKNEAGYLNIISGTGLDENLKLLNDNTWHHILSEDKETSDLNGHFVVISENQDGLTIINDQLGLREVFFYESENEILFSTRLDWMIRLIKSPQFNLRYLNSYWNFETPLNFETFCNGVKLLGPGGKAKITQKGLTIENKTWCPKKLDVGINDVIDLISQTLDSIIQEKGKINLALSGGIDSRTILALLLDYDKNLWETHTFGHKAYFDVKIANSIAQKLKFNHKNHYYKPDISHDMLGEWQDFVLETNAILPSNIYHELSYYNSLPKEEFLIDGGKGSILRRCLSKRLSTIGKNDLLSKNLNNVKKLLFNKKPQIFNTDVTQNWESYQNEEVSRLMQAMPEPSEIGVDNWVDLYCIRYKTANTSYPSQTRLDSIVSNIMPYIQPKILSAIFNLPEKDRINENINRSIINRHKELKSFPLARYKTFIPFQYNKYSSLIWSKIMRTFFKDELINHRFFINSNKEFLNSRLRDSDFINSSIYDTHKISTKVNDYFLGKSDDTNFIIWFMTFDVWNRLFNRRNFSI